MTTGGFPPVGPYGQGPGAQGGISLEQVIQNLSQGVQYLGRLITDLEGGKAQLWQPYNALLTSIAALSATLTTGNVIVGSGLGTVAVGNRLATAKLTVWAASTTYTADANLIVALLGVVGGGAGGGGCANSSAGSEGSGGGGGGGSTSLALKTAAQIGASQTVTIGAVANGGTAGNNNGTAGNDTSIGALCIGKGGSAGGGAAANTGGSSGAGGVAGTGDILIPGAAGGRGMNSTIVSFGILSGNGGSSGMGFGAGGRLAVGGGDTTGLNGSNYGGGGSGGVSANAAGAAAGGNGAQGLAFALEFVRQ